MSYTLQIGSGTPQTFAALGISAAVLTEDVIGGSFLQIEAAQTIDEAALIAAFQKVTLRSADTGTVRFVGWLDTAPASANGSRHVHTYTLAGPHRWLDRAYYKQPIGTGGSSAPSGLAYIGGDAAGAENQTPKDLAVVLSDILDTCLSTYPAAFSYAGEDTWTHQIPVERRVDSTCLAALRAALSYAPSTVLWWTYSGPTLNIAAAAASAQITLSTATHDIDAATLNPRYDLLRDTVTVKFLKDGAVASTQTAASAGDAASLSADRELLVTFDAGSLYNVPDSGLADALAQWHQRLHIDGQASHLSIDWAEHPGLVYGFGGDLAQYTGRRTLLHTIKRDLFADKTALQFGVIPGKTIYALGARSDANNGGGGGGSGPENGTLHVNLVENDDLPVSLVGWTTNGASGSGSDSISVPPGSYTVVAFPLFDVDTGKWWFPTGPDTAVVSAGGSGTATITFATANRIVLQAGSPAPGGSVPKIDLNAADLSGMAADTAVKAAHDYLVVINGALKTARFTSSQPVDPE